MRDDAYYDHDDDIAEGSGRGWGAAAAAVLSVGVLAALIAWSYRLGVRDAHEVPVVRAMVKELRIAPTDPGGQQVEHQDRRVYETMTRVAPPPVRGATLAPAPEALAREDVPMGRLASRTEADAGLPPAGGDPDRRSVDDLVALAAGQDDGRPSRSPLPPARPGRQAGSRGASVQPVDGPSAAPGAASGMAPGTPAIQLGAYLSEDVARAMWQALASRNGDLLAGRRPVVSVIDGPNRRLFGLRAAPFASRAEAQGLCAALRARNEDCLVTVLN